MHDAMAVERSCALTAVALSGQRREGVRLVTGERRDFGLSSHTRLRPRPVPVDRTGLDAQNADMRCRTAMFTVKGTTRRVPAQRAVSARTACANTRRGRRRPGLDRLELARTARRSAPGAARPPTLPADTDAERDAQSGNRDVTHRRAAERSSVLGRVALGLHRAAGIVRQAAAHLRQNAVDHNAKTPAPPLLGSGRRRRRGAQPQPAATQPAAGQRPRHHTTAPPGHPLSRVEFLDKEFHAGPCCRSRTRACHPYASPGPVSADLRKWFEEHTHRAMKNRLEDGSDLDVEQYVQPLHRPRDWRSDRTAHLSRSAAHQPRRHNSATA